RYSSGSADQRTGHPSHGNGRAHDYSGAGEVRSEQRGGGLPAGGRGKPLQSLFSPYLWVANNPSGPKVLGRVESSELIRQALFSESFWKPATVCPPAPVGSPRAPTIREPRRRKDCK